MSDIRELAEAMYDLARKQRGIDEWCQHAADQGVPRSMGIPFEMQRSRDEAEKRAEELMDAYIARRIPHIPGQPLA